MQTQNSNSNGNTTAAARMQSAAQRVAARVLRAGVPVWGPYTLDVTLEGLAALGTALGEARYVECVCDSGARRGWTAEHQPAGGTPPFTLLMWEIVKLKGTAYHATFVAASRAYCAQIARDAHGMVLHPRGAQWGGGHAVLLDSMQEYCRRMAAAGVLSGERQFFDECTRQFRLHHDVLCDPASGLWRQGRGWHDDPREVSEGAWSRGHGWLVRGLVESLRCMPRGAAAYGELQALLAEVAGALLRVQAADGMWHAVLSEPAGCSPAESSGTGMIAYALARAVADGALPRDTYAPAVQRAWAGLAACVAEDGTVLHACPGPGPLRPEHMAQYRVKDFAPGEAHGAGALLLAGAGAALLQET